MRDEDSDMQLNAVDQEVLEILRKAGDFGLKRQSIFDGSEIARDAQEISIALSKLKSHGLVSRIGDKRGANGYTWLYVEQEAADVEPTVESQPAMVPEPVQEEKADDSELRTDPDVALVSELDRIRRRLQKPEHVIVIRDRARKIHALTAVAAAVEGEVGRLLAEVADDLNALPSPHETAL